MNNELWTVVISSVATLSGVAISLWSSARNNDKQARLSDQRLTIQAEQTAKREALQSSRADRRDAVQWEQAAAREAAQAERVAQQAAAQWGRHQDDKRTALLMAKQEEFLGLVLESEQLMTGYLMAHHSGQAQSSATLSDPCSVSARRAYVVALLYLADVLPLAKAFHLSTLELQLVLMSVDKSSLGEKTIRWRDSIKEIEAALAL